MAVDRSVSLRVAQETWDKAEELVEPAGRYVADKLRELGLPAPVMKVSGVLRLALERGLPVLEAELEAHAATLEPEPDDFEESEAGGELSPAEVKRLLDRMQRLTGSKRGMGRVLGRLVPGGWPSDRLSRFRNGKRGLGDDAERLTEAVRELAALSDDALRSRIEEVSP